MHTHTRIFSKEKQVQEYVKYVFFWRERVEVSIPIELCVILSRSDAHIWFWFN